VRGQGVVVEVQPIAGKDGETSEHQALVQLVDDGVGSHLSARPQLESRDQLAQRIESQPEPEDLVARAQASADLVDLDVGKTQVQEASLVEGLAMLASAMEPASDRRLLMAKDPHGCRDVEPLGKSGEDFGDPSGSGLETVQGSVATGGEGVTTSLAAKGLDAFALAVAAIANECVDPGVGDAEVGTGGVFAGKALSVDALRSTTAALDLGPGRMGE
jgi:hypothetical protein